MSDEEALEPMIPCPSCGEAMYRSQDPCIFKLASEMTRLKAALAEITTLRWAAEMVCVARAALTPPSGGEPTCDECHDTSPNAVTGNGQYVNGKLLCDDCHAKRLVATPYHKPSGGEEATSPAPETTKCQECGGYPVAPKIVEVRPSPGVRTWERCTNACHGTGKGTKTP